MLMFDILFVSRAFNSLAIFQPTMCWYLRSLVSSIPDQTETPASTFKCWGYVMCSHALLIECWGSNQGLTQCQKNSMLTELQPRQVFLFLFFKMFKHFTSVSCECFDCMYVYHVHAWCPWKSEEGSIFPRTRDTDGCELPCGAETEPRYSMLPRPFLK